MPKDNTPFSSPELSYIGTAVNVISTFRLQMVTPYVIKGCPTSRGELRQSHTLFKCRCVHISQGMAHDEKTLN